MTAVERDLFIRSLKNSDFSKTKFKNFQVKIFFSLQIFANKIYMYLKLFCF